MVILIADDDKLVRFSIKSMLGEILEDNGDVFIEAANGRDMVKMCQNKKPDVAFVDIKMPYMNGLDAINESRKCSENTEYVIVSGYSDFEYAQRGIRLGVNEYILKPIDEDEIRKVIEKIKKKVNVRKEESNSRFQLEVMRRFNNHSADIDEDAVWKVEESGYTYLGFVIYVKTSLRDRMTSVQIQKELVKNIKKLGKEIVNRKGYYAIPTTKDGFPCGVFRVKEEQREYIVSYMRKLIMEAKRKNSENFQYIIWFEEDSLDGVCKICDMLDQEGYMGINQNSGDIYEYQELEMDDKNKEFLQMVDQLMNAWEIADGMACNEVMNKLYESCGRKLVCSRTLCHNSIKRK